MRLQVSLLGPPRVERDGDLVSFDTRKATALLAYLALAGRACSREALTELLWPGKDAGHARGALRRTLSTLRKAVGDEWIDSAGDSVALVTEPGLELDVARFRALAGEGATLEQLSAAAELFRGTLLEGFSLRDSPEFDTWQVVEADTLGRELSSVLGRLVEMLAGQGRHDQAIAHARRRLELDPLHEPAQRDLIRLYAWNGDRAAALDQYRQCVRTLGSELGVAPLDETAALFELVSEGTLPPPGAVSDAGSATAAQLVGRRPEELPLVGRGVELRELVAAHRSVAERGRLAVVEGEAGIGKTRLAQELLDQARADGAIVLAARCHEDEAGLPYGPVLELLGRASRERLDELAPQRLADVSLLAPGLLEGRPDLPQPVPLAGPGAQARLLDALVEVLSSACRGPAAGVICIDDVHAADEATLDVLGYLARRLSDRRLLLLVSWRSEAVPPGHRLRALAADLSRDDAVTVVRPVRLNEEQVARLVRAARKGGEEAELERRVFLESEGLPLFVVEYLAALGADAEPEEGTLPSEIRSILGARLGGVGRAALQVLGAAAVIGRSFDLDLVRDASGRSDDETVAALDELVARGIVHEAPAGEPAYDFSHQKLRALAYEEIGLARRRLLHRRVAASLAKGSRGGEGAALVAQHLRLAGDHSEAAVQYRLAAEHAASLLAHGDALEQLEAALALGGEDEAALHERIGDLRTLTGDYGGALAAYESAAARSDGSALAAAEHKLGDVHQRRGEWGRAEARFRTALDVAPPDERALRARIQADLSLALHHAGRSQQAEALAREALALAEAANDRRAQAQAHNMLGVLSRSAGELRSARVELGRSEAIAVELDDPAAQTAALNNLALVSRDAGELEQALELTERALALCAAYGDRHREAALENNLADIHHELERPDESMAHLKRAVAIFSEVGADEATRLPEIWKLVSW